MRRRFLMLVAVIVALGTQPTTAAGQDATVAAVTAVDLTWGRAYVACDGKTWDALLADHLTFIHNNGAIDDKAKQMASVKQCGIESLNSQVTSVRIYGDDTAVVLGAMQGTVKEGDFQFDLLYTRVYILQNGGWRLVAHQSTDAPQRGAS